LQFLFFDFRPSSQADTDEARFWRTLFGVSPSSGKRVVSIGLSRAAGTAQILAWDGALPEEQPFLQQQNEAEWFTAASSNAEGDPRR
jgi:hypothetical protein